MTLVEVPPSAVIGDLEVGVVRFGGGTDQVNHPLEFLQIQLEMLRDRGYRWES